MVKRLLEEKEIEDMIRKELRFLSKGTISKCKGVEDDWGPEVYWKEIVASCVISPENAPAVEHTIEFEKTWGELAPNTVKIFFKERA